MRSKRRNKPFFERDDGAVLDVGAIDKDRRRRRKRTRDVMRDTQGTVDGGRVSALVGIALRRITAVNAKHVACSRGDWRDAGDEQTRQDEVEYQGVGGDKRRHPAYLSLENEPPHPPDHRLRSTTAREDTLLPAHNTTLRNISLGAATGSTAVLPCDRLPQGKAMRRRLKNFLPLVLVALFVQILAPIAATWAIAMAAADPLQSAEICHTVSGTSSGQSDHSGGQPAHDGACAICCAVQASASIDAPLQAAFTVPHVQPTHVDWTIAAPDLSPFRAGSNTQARAPPLPM